MALQDPIIRLVMKAGFTIDGRKIVGRTVL